MSALDFSLGRVLWTLVWDEYFRLWFGTSTLDFGLGGVLWTFLFVHDHVFLQRKFLSLVVLLYGYK